MPKPPALSFAAEQVRLYDRDRFVTGLFAPADRREDLFALYAFNLEVAKVREVVREPMMGRIRLQWWRDAVAVLAQGGAPPPHPIGEALATAMRRHRFDEAALQRLIDGREADLDDEPPADMAALEGYAEATSASVTGLALTVLGVEAAAAHRAGRHVGIAWALTGLLRAVPFHASQGRLMLPPDLLAAHGVGPAEILAGKASPGLAAVARDVAVRAAGHLRSARALRREMPAAAVPALLPARLADAYLGALRRADHAVFDTAWSAPRPRPLRLAVSALLRRW